MNRFLAVALCFICCTSLADFFRPGAATITWAATNKLPSTVEVYGTVQTNFSLCALSSAMAMGSFKPIDMTSQGKDMLVFESRQRNVLMRCLRLSQSQGLIDYFKVQTNYSSIHGVPSFDETKRLALLCLQRFGGDTNQVSAKLGPRTEQTVETYTKQGGALTNTAVSVRGIMLCRMLDGIECSDSLLIEFGNDAMVSLVKMNWRYLVPHQRIKVPSKHDIIEMIKSGRATVLPNVNGDDLPEAKTFTITKVTPIYRLRDVGQLASPSLDFEVIGDMGKTNATTIYLECPILATNRIE